MKFDPAPLRRRYLAALGLLPLVACGQPDTECIFMESAEDTCPSVAEAREQLLGDHCGYSVNAVTGEGEMTEVSSGFDTSGASPACCYPTREQEDLVPSCVVGRPYFEGAEMRTAPPRAASGWAAGNGADVRGLTDTERAVLATAWTEDALVEHASVAAFARTTLELLAVGAPAELVAAVQRAAADEVRHARLSFALAEAYAGAPVSPGAFPVGPNVAIETDLARIAASTFREGCVGETVVALLSARAAADTKDEAARALLLLVASDEARHAELAWRTLAWALAEGGQRARDAVLVEVDRLLERGVTLTQVTTGASDDVLAAHGRIRPEPAAEARARAVEEVILPCVRALLAQPTPTFHADIVASA